MRDVSPAYLEAMLGHLEGLAWIEDTQVQAAGFPAGKVTAVPKRVKRVRATKSMSS
jgi:hypothetical protein